MTNVSNFRDLLQNKPDHLKTRLTELKTELRHQDPEDLSRRTGCSFHRSGRNADTQPQGRFEFQLWNQDVWLSWPELTATPVQSSHAFHSGYQALILYYFSTASGIPITGRWIGFNELPDGRFYAQAFHSYTGQVLERRYTSNIKAFAHAAQYLHGKEIHFGDLAYEFSILPRVSILIVHWLGDEDFQGVFRLLFDANLHEYLPLDACAIAGSMLTHRLIHVE